MRYYDTVEKFNAFMAKEPEYRKRYLAALETLQVNLPPADEEYLPYRKTDDLFRTAKRLRENAVALADAGLDPYEVADLTEKHAIREKAVIGARREIRAIDDEWADEIIALLYAFLDDAIHMMHHLKRLSKIENDPNGYYTQEYRRIYSAYRQTMHNLHGGKARGRGRRKKAKVPIPMTLTRSKP